MANNITAYIGLDYIDHMLYTAWILIGLGMRVLVVDHSETQALKNSIPQPDGVDCDDSIIKYRNLDFTCAILDQRLTDTYDDIFIAYGLKEPDVDIALCNRVVCVTDLYRYNHIRVGEYIRKHGLDQIKRRELLIRDAIAIKITTELIEEWMGIAFPMDNIKIIFRDDKDYYNSVINHTNRSFYFTAVSKQLRNYILQEAGGLYPRLRKKQLIAAYRMAGRGNCRQEIGEL